MQIVVPIKWLGGIATLFSITCISCLRTDKLSIEKCIVMKMYLEKVQKKKFIEN